MTRPKIKVDIVSDVVCPWCYIGKRRLEKAIDSLKEKFDFELEYHPFELNPDTPISGVNQQEYLTKKFGGGEARYQQLTNHVTQVAAGEGLHFNFAKQHVLPNTRDAHRVIQFAKQEGKQPEAKEAFMKAYFEDGIDLSKKENLIDVAVQAGLSKQAVEKLLSTEEGRESIVKVEREMQQLGITGVPFYIINNKYGVSGAQPSTTFIQAFEDIGSQVVLSGEACDVDLKNC
ncbi:MAG TPA: DsbA family oxidoreductase [Cyclobacteriaceae bacterium]|nr:DsbA family oxidoreductase [Cyclobacteriaceae bacterium]